MENKKITEIFILIFALLIVVVLGVFIFKNIESSKKASDNESATNTSASANSLIAEPAILETYPLDMKYVKVYLTDAKGNKSSEVTNSVSWTSDQPDMVAVASADPIKGQVVAQKEGNYSITAAYQDKEVTIPVNVEKAVLKIYCKADPVSAKVGQKVTWIMMFEKIGTPRYKYSIIGSDGLNGKEGLATITYKTPGVKNVQMKAIDYTGTEASVTCDPYIVSAK
jgi:hypothetical protein